MIKGGITNWTIALGMMSSGWVAVRSTAMSMYCPEAVTAMLSTESFAVAVIGAECSVVEVTVVWMANPLFDADNPWDAILSTLTARHQLNVGPWPP